MTPAPRSWPWWRWVLTGLSALALGLSASLAWHFLQGGSVPGCGGGSPCDRVLNSRWSTVAGVLPVAGLAAGLYLAILVAVLSIGPSSPPPVRRLAWRVLLVLVGAAAGGALWFIALQQWAVGAFCPYCLATHLTGLLLAAVVLWLAPRQGDEGSVPGVSPTPHHLGRRPVLGLTLVGLGLAGILAACQIGFLPQAVYRAGASPSLPGIDPRTAPLLGSPQAPYVVILLFDYKCPHCQQLHFQLQEAFRRYSGKLAFALCPAPLNRQCNPYVPRDVDEFKDSCELAKIGLAVWVARREAFPEFDRWMFSFESGDRWQPRSLEAARAKAVELVGLARFKAARADPWIDQYLQTCIRIFGDTGTTAIPKLVFGSRWVIPQRYDPDALVSILQDSLGVPAP